MIMPHEVFNNALFSEPYLRILGKELFDIWVDCKVQLLDENFLKNGENADKTMDKLEILDTIIETFLPEDEQPPHGTVYQPEDLVKMIKLLDFELKDKCLNCVKQNIERIGK